MRQAWTARLGALAVVLLMAVTSGCAGSRVADDREANTGNAGQETSGEMIPQLVFPAERAASVGTLVNFNPYSPDPITRTYLYEPLMVQSTLDCKVTPWLATDYSWETPTTLVFTIREGVKWSDGTLLTPEDVAFTINLMKKYPAMDRAGIWTKTLGAPAKSVTVRDNQVVLEFTGNAVAKFSKILREVLIVQKKQFSEVGDPTKYVQEEPVATGPFTVGSYNGRRLVLERRDDYWQADSFKVQKLILEGNYDANQAAAKLRSGELDWYSGEIPNPEKTFVEADPEHNHVWYAPNGMTVLVMNLKRKPFSDVKFREALAYAIDKERATQKATYGLMDVASQSGLPMPAKAAMLPEGMTPENTVIPHDLDKANQLLDEAGYEKGSDGIRRNPDGSPISITVSVQADWIDYAAVADQAVSDLKKLGLNIKGARMQPEAVDRLKKTHDFDMMVGYMAAGCDYANGMGGTIDSRKIPSDKELKPNVGQYSNPEVDNAIDELQSTTDPAQEKQLVGVLVDAMMTDYPVIPMFYAPARSIYRSDKAVGWPTAEDPYCNPQDNRRLWLSKLRAPAQ